MSAEKALNATTGFLLKHGNESRARADTWPVKNTDPPGWRSSVDPDEVFD